jgi:protein phosphatase
LGGYAAGEVASRIAREFVEKRAEEIAPEMGPEEAADVITRILEDANDEIFLMSKKPEYMGMGTTAVVVKLVKSGGEMKAVVAHVGDSRLYRLPQNGELEEITLDDGPVRDQFHNERQAREAQRKLSNVTHLRNLNVQEASLFASRNRVSQHLGRTRVVPHLQILEVKPGDVLILTSDGVHDNLTDREIEAICSSFSGSGETATRLAANSLSRSRGEKERNIRSHPDDISAVVVKIGEK